MPDLRVRFAFKVYRRPFRVPVRTSRGLWEARDGILVRIDHSDGSPGFGEAAPLESFGTETLAGAVAWCANLVGRVDVEQLQRIPPHLPACGSAMSAALRVPGTAAESAKAIDVACLLPAGDGAFEGLERALDAGFSTFKLKIAAFDFAAECATIDRLVERLPGGARLRLDANGGCDVRAAVRWLDAATNWPVEFVEQPLPVAAGRELVRLANDHATPVALDESVRGADDIKRWRDLGWSGIFVLKPALAGPPAAWMPEVAIAPGQFVFSSALETSVGAAAGLRLACTAGITRALGYGVSAFFPDDGLGGGIDRPRLTSDFLATINPELVWNRL